MPLFKYSVNIEGSLEEDYQKNIENKIKKPIRAGLKALDSDMRYLLELNIRTNVYPKYEPITYERRVDNPEYGTSISDMDKTVYSELIGSNILRFVYSPVGAHSQYPTMPYNDGDLIISTIETGRGYPWIDTNDDEDDENRTPDDELPIPPRPFWTPFVSELFDSGQAEFSFIKGFNANNNGVGTLVFDDDMELSSSDDYTFEF